MRAIKNNACAMDAIVEAIKYLEDDPCSNAGYGSNLNTEGYVECDASLMDGDSLLFGCVGALSNIKNPIEVANHIVNRQKLPNPLGLIAPNLLVGEGARKFALEKGCEAFDLKSGS